ncbi:MAG: hypothetical protein NTY22_04255 [Proteobacteria bacterium]|nr:hypothetical protein [Pseudomonadota bacterium]
MKNLKGVFSIVAAILFVVSSCSNNTTASSSSGSSTTTTVVASALIFSGIADGATVTVAFFDDYLEKVLNGNPYNNITNTPPASIPYLLPFEIKITSFYYYLKGVDITCSKDVYNNKVFGILTGSLPNGHEAIFAMSIDGYFYACDTTINSVCSGAAWVPQGPQDEITSISMPKTDPSNPANPYNPTYECTGSDGNDYIVGLYGDYYQSNLHINNSFNIKTGIFNGVISVQMKNYNDKPIDLFVE